MSPRTSTFLAFVGVLLAGIPLPLLTAARRDSAPAAEPAAPAVTRAVYATLQCSGQPSELSLRHEGHELVHLLADELGAPWEAELPLPVGKPVALEVEARWNNGEQAQAVTISLEPDGQPAQQHTEWTQPGSPVLHSLFTFSW